jgi:hypothetical protein
MSETKGRSEGGPVDELRLRVAASTYISFGVVFGILILLSAALAVSHPAAWRSVAILVAILAAFLLYFSRLEVVVAQGAISYRTFFLRRSLSLTDIAESRVQWNVGGRDHRPLLIVKSARSGKQLKVNLKPYRREDIVRLLGMPQLKLRKTDGVAQLPHAGDGGRVGE